MTGRTQLTRISVALLSSSLMFGALPAGAEPDAFVAHTPAHVVSAIDTATNVVLGTIPVGVSPVRVAVTLDGARAYVTNTASDSVSVIDTATRTVVATVPVAASPEAVAVTPDGGEVYVAASGGVLQVIATALIGTATDPVIATISFGPSFEVETSIAILPDGTRAYAVVSGFLRVIDTATHAVLGSLYVGSSPSQLAISPDGARAYVSSAFGYDPIGFDGQVVVVDTVTNSVLDAIPVYGVPDSIAVTPDGARAYVSIVARFWNTGYGMGFLRDTTVAVLDLAANEPTNWILLSGTPAGVAVTPDGSSVYVAVPRTNSIASIAVIDTATDSLAAAISVAAGPNGLAIAPTRAYVGCETGADCDDNAPCTDDTCDSVSGACTHAFNSAPCNDGNACTSGDVCSGGQCAGSDSPNCNDNNPCTTDGCNPATGSCTHGFTTAACNDGNACTSGDVCSGGQCAGSGAPNCNDNNPCTTDGCDPATGSCTHGFTTAPCDDGNACTSGDVCESGVCVGTCEVGKLCGGGCKLLRCTALPGSCRCRAPQ